MSGYVLILLFSSAGKLSFVAIVAPNISVSVSTASDYCANQESVLDNCTMYVLLLQVLLMN
jgi:hypothetical protein